MNKPIYLDVVIHRFVAPFIAIIIEVQLARITELLEPSFAVEHDRLGPDSAIFVDAWPVHGEALVRHVVSVLGASNVLEQRRGAAAMAFHLGRWATIWTWQFMSVANW